ncbi:MAG: porin family protein [Desulfobulbaceae bacterium]|nr:MAG: porin family protein [Desulfobulbaceae bacterium]
MKKIILLVLILCSTPATLYADALIYGGIGAGYAESEGSGDAAFGVHIGTGLVPFVGLEVGFWDFGSFNSFDYSSFYLAAKPSLDLGAVHLFAKLGLNSFDKDGDRTLSDDGVDLMYGLGAEYFFTDNVSAGASYTSFGFDGEDVSTFTVNLTFHLL